MTIRQASGIVVGQAMVGIGVALALRTRASSEVRARRRIERDLHDGAQQRLVALALRLRSAERDLDERAEPEVGELLVSAAEELQTAVREIRELVEGSVPAVARDQGLAVALAALAARAPLPVAFNVSLRPLPPEVESTAYLVASEGLANVLKHAGASRAAIGARRRDKSLLVEVTDDGVGGAHGLRSLADRVEARGGRLSVTSPAGGGTRVLAEIPCAS